MPTKKTRKSRQKATDTHKPMVFSSPADVGYSILGIKRINEFNTPILKFTVGDCSKYVSSYLSEYYLETRDAIHYVNTDKYLNPDWVQSKFKAYQDMWNAYEGGNFQQFSYVNDDIQYVDMTGTKCYVPHYLASASAYINGINAELAKHGIHVEINELPNMSAVDLWIYEGQTSHEILDDNYVLLCVNFNNSCISSIVLAPEYENPDNIEIISATKHEMQGRGYNTILRAVAIAVAKMVWPNAEAVVSKAVSPISAWLMISKFGAETDITNMDEIDIYIYNAGSILTSVPLDAEHVDKAKQVLHKYY